MKQRKIPMRTCVITRQKCEKKDLIRIIRTPQKSVEIDLSGKKNGKGAYLKKDIEVIKKAQNSKILDKVLEVEVNDSIYDQLLEIVNTRRVENESK